jgi:DNA-binding SARP family transcriptional activator
VSAYHDLRAVLAEEMGVDPAPATQDTYRAMLTGSAAA